MAFAVTDADTDSRLDLFRKLAGPSGQLNPYGQNRSADCLQLQNILKSGS